jgi:hypothetical protein
MRRLDDEVRQRLQTRMGRSLTRRELHKLGVTDTDVRRLVRSGQLHHVNDRYVDGGFERDVALVVCAQAGHPGSVLSHFTAARLTELRTWVDGERQGPPTAAVWLTRQPGTGRNESGPDVVLRLAGLDPRDVRLHHARRLDQGVHCLDRVAVTTEARTVVDLARELPLRESMVTVDHALTFAVTRAALEEVLQRQQGWPGINRARAAVAFGDPRSESALESIARVAFADAGLPPPVLQAQFWDGTRWMPERTDFWWPQFRTHAEADGLAKFEAATPAERRRLHRQAFHREQRLADRGAELVRFGWEDAVNTPAELAARMAQAFGRGLHRGGDPITWRADDPQDPRRWPRVYPTEEEEHTLPRT